MLSVAGVTLTASPSFGQSDRQRFVSLKPGQVVIDSATAVECLRWYFGNAVARDSYEKLLLDAEKQAQEIKWKNLIKGFAYGLATGVLTTTVYIIARKQ